MRDKVRFGIFGAGDFGPSFSKYIGEVADVVAVCDPSPASIERFRTHTGWDLPSYSHPEDLLSREQIDAAAILSPNFTHRDITVAAAQRGLHVYCEKAMAVSVPDCWDMVRACD
ncbi:MAG: Gfo/Idh/MocA family oxidoreductase [Bryobacteraceae bacterium]